MLLGQRADASAVAAYLEHRPLKMATSCIQGCHTVGHFPPAIAEFSCIDTSWTARHYDRSLDVLCLPGW